MNRKIKEIRKYRDDYRELKKQIKRHMCRALYIDRKYLKKKNRFNKRKYTDKLYQQRFNEKIISARN